MENTEKRRPGRKKCASKEATDFLNMTYLLILARLEVEKRWSLPEALEWLGVRDHQRMRWYFDGLERWELIESIGRYRTQGRPRVYELTDAGKKYLRRWRRKNRWWTARDGSAMGKYTMHGEGES